jgi:glutaredoxin
MDPVPQPAPPRTCAKHGVVLDPFGQCVICRRELVDEDDDPSGARKAGFALVALGLIVAGALVLKAATTRRPEAPVITIDAGAAPQPALAPALDDLDVAQAEARAAAITREDTQRKASLEKTMREVPIRIYTAKRCDLCRTATAFFGSKGWVWEEIDVNADRENLAALRKLNPAGTVPTIVVGEEVIVGYGPSAVLAAVYRYADKKVR